MISKLNYKILFFCTLLFTFFFLTLRCESDEGTINCFPYTTVSATVNLSLPQYQNLNNIYGWAYVSGEMAGTRGLIVVRTGENSFKAYDRNAPHICPTANSTLEVQDDIKIVCPEDGASWILTSGQPLTVAGVAPKTYFVYFNGNSLIITN